MEPPRTLLVFAHPDDETVAVGARMGRFGGAHFVHVTDGAPRNEQDSQWHKFDSWREYRAARAQELESLFAGAGIESATRECLNIPDQEADFHLVDLSERLAHLIAEHAPEVIFTHPYEGGHPDHDACAFAIHHAVALCKRAGLSPLIIEGAFYNAVSGSPGSFCSHESRSAIAEYRLTSAEQKRKLSLIQCFTTQQQTLSGFPLDWERFRVAPSYDFSRPPHPPPLLYDRYPWGMTSQRFVQMAKVAEETLHHARP